MEPFIGFATMMLIMAGANIVQCCGAGMLGVMWEQLDILVNRSCGEGCEMLIASLEAEFDGCIGCAPHMDG